jgi:UDP-glucose 4-epimerase
LTIPSSAVWLVTGGAGFIGSHVAEALVRSERHVRVVDNFSTGSWDNVRELDPRVAVMEGDLRDPQTARDAVKDVEVVFHLAALPSVPRSLADPWASHDHNVNATVQLLEASRSAGVRRFVFSSSSSVYGDTPSLPKAESAEPLPKSPYAASKLASEQYVLAYARSRLLDAVALRYFNIFGQRQRPDSAYAAVIPLLFRAAIEGKAASVFGDGEQTRDFTHVSNAVAANLAAATRPAEQVSGWVFNVGAGNRTSLLKLVQLVRDVTALPLAVRHEPPRPGDVRDSLAGLARSGERLGYQPDVSLEAGLRMTWEWFKATYSHPTS